MFGTMADTPLLVSRILEHAAERHGGSTVTGFVGDLEPHRPFHERDRLLPAAGVGGDEDDLEPYPAL